MARSPRQTTARQCAILDRARATPGFLPSEELEMLFGIASRAQRLDKVPFAEIGAYRGRSTLVLAAALAGRAQGDHRGVVFSIDHHHGSEEMQAGWPDHDPSLVDASSEMIDSLGSWRRTLVDARAEDLVIGVIGDSRTIADNWRTPLGLIFLDGGHGKDIAWADYTNWSSHLEVGGLLIFHDVYPDPRDGGRPPFECYSDALSSRRFTEDRGAAVGSLRVLVKHA